MKKKKSRKRKGTGRGVRSPSLFCTFTNGNDPLEELCLRLFEIECEKAKEGAEVGEGTSIRREAMDRAGDGSIGHTLGHLEKSKLT